MLIVLVLLGGFAVAWFALFVALSVVAARGMTKQEQTSQLRDIDVSPAEGSLPFEDVAFLATDGLRLSGWLISHPNADTVIVYVPGGSVNRLQGDANDTMWLIGTLFRAGHSILLYDPRSSGRSKGERRFFGGLECRDVAGAIKFLGEKGYRRDRVAVVAFSMGGAAAMLALRETSMGALWLDSPMNNLDQALLRKFSNRPVAMLAGSGGFLAARVMWGVDLFRVPTEELRRNPLPTMVVHGTADEVIPLGMGEAAAAAAGKHLIGAHYLEGVAHVQAVKNRVWYSATLLDFFDGTLVKGAQAEA